MFQHKELMLPRALATIDSSCKPHLHFDNVSFLTASILPSKTGIRSLSVNGIISHAEIAWINSTLKRWQSQLCLFFGGRYYTRPKSKIARKRWATRHDRYRWRDMGIATINGVTWAPMYNDRGGPPCSLERSNYFVRCLDAVSGGDWLEEKGRDPRSPCLNRVHFVKPSVS